MLVVAGLVVSIAAGVFLIELPAGELPGIALESAAMLVIERIAILFATWLLAVVVVVRSLAGDLPVEVSGRGFRYADAAIAQKGLLDSEGAFERLDQEVDELRQAVAIIEAKQDGLAKSRDDML